MTLLRTLEGLPPPEAERALLDLAFRFLPEPQGPSTAAATSRESLLLQEIGQRLGVDPGDRSRQTVAKVLKLLADELYGITLQGVDEASVRGRVGQRGLLPPDLYRVDFTPEFDELWAPLSGVSKREIADVVSAPDQVEHVLRVADPGTQLALSWCTKYVGAPQVNAAFTLLVESRRQADEHYVTAVWRVYHSEVSRSEGLSPLATLRRFLSVYGIPFRVPNSSMETLLLMYDAFLIPGGQPTGPQSLMQFFTLGRRSDHIVGSQEFRVSPLGALQIAIAYFVDAGKYQDHLRQHGVRVSSF
jgi:hypothetical protein